MLYVLLVEGEIGDGILALETIDKRTLGNHFTVLISPGHVQCGGVFQDDRE